MLPSTGLFKSFTCPYYESTGGDGAKGCQRPYCHFKHVRKEEVEASPAQTKVPEYTPAPKLLTLPQLSIYAPKKKNNLEYQPEKPELNASPSKHKQNELNGAPLYVPAQTNGEDDSPLDLTDCQEELDELSNLIDDQIQFEASENSLLNTIPVSEKVAIEKEEPPEPFMEIKEKTNKPSSDKKYSDKEELRRNSSTSTSSSSKHKHKLSSKSRDSSHSREHKSCKDNKHKSDKNVHKIEKVAHKNDKDVHKSDKDVHKSEKDAHKSDKDRDRSKHREGKRDSERSSRDKKDRGSSSKQKTKTSSTSSADKSNDSNKRHHSHSSSDGHKKRSVSTTSSSKHKSSTKPQHKSESKDETQVLTSPTSFVVEDINADIANLAELFPTSEEDIRKECEMVYEQLEQQFATLHKEQADKEIKEDETTRKRKPPQSIDDYAESAAASLQKKRVAYENADRVKSYQIPRVQNKPNHIQNAMQAIFERRNELHRQQKEKAAKDAEELRIAEEKVREANEALRKVQEKNLTPTAPLTPLIPKSYLSRPTKPNVRSFAPVANILAFERAKKKVEELKAEKQHAFTPAQTSKGSQRMAHKPTTPLGKVEATMEEKPPVLESKSTKISFNIRMQYYDMMVKQCIAIYPNIADAWERAQTEELAVLKKCNTPVIYKSSSMLTINKLRKEAVESGNKPVASNKIISHEVILAGKLAQNTSWSVQKKLKNDVNIGSEPFDKLPSDQAYNMIYDLHLNDEQLLENGYPRPGRGPGTAVIQNSRPMRRPNETERYCSRCGKVFNMEIYDKVCVDMCNYHPKSTGYRRGFSDNHHRCCQQPAGTPGCTYANYHVTDYYDGEKLTNFVSTIDKPEDYVPTKKDIYAVDCEMCYTTHGIELTRVTVVDINSRTVYDALVKPDNKIIDYNTIYSGITEEMLARETRTLRDVQAILMSMFHSRTVLVGHSLESDFKALKLIHNVVVDTSVLFPHKMGPPKKRALKTLCIENLKRIIQENEAGHDSAEDAEVCIQLVKFYLRNKIS